jgi:ketosteroid isomerase-like protein
MPAETGESRPAAERNIALLGDYLEAINRWDFAAMEQMLHADIEYELPYAPPPFPRTTRGHAAVMAFLRALPDFAAEANLCDIRIDAMAQDAAELVAEYRSEMKLMSGRTYANRYLLRATVRDGRIARFTEHFDPIALVQALGGSVVLPSA